MKIKMRCHHAEFDHLMYLLYGGITNDSSISELGLYDHNDLFDRRCVHAPVGASVSAK